MHIGKELRSIKLKKLVETQGYDCLDDMLEATITDSVSPAICIEPHCSYACEMEPDQDHGYCEACDRNTMVSALVLAGLV